MSDAQPQAGVPERFFPFNTRCTGCGYELHGCTPGTCPECGEVTIDLAVEGRRRPITEQERALAERYDYRTGEQFRPAYLLRISSATSVLLLILVMVVGVLPLLLEVDSPRGLDGGALIRAGVVVALVLAGQLLFRVFGFSRVLRARWELVQADLRAGEVEECVDTVSHAALVRGRDGKHLLLRVPRAVLGFVPWFTSEVLQEPGAPVAARLRLAYLPRSRLPAGAAFEGEPVKVVVRPDVAAVEWWDDRAEPVRCVRSEAELVRVPRGGPPVFADAGPR